MDISNDTYVVIKKKKCSSCGIPVDNLHQTYCKPCKNKYMRERYKDPIEKKKQIARKKAREMLIKGVIKKENCKFCGSDSKIEMHHLDYDEPTNIIWLCVPCHCNLHKEQNNVFSSGHS